MNIFFDTSVLAAALERNHPHYPRAWPVVRRVLFKEDKGFFSAHSIAELFVALSRMPVTPRIQPLEAVRIITETVLPHFEAVTVDVSDYKALLHMVADAGQMGAKIYDALLLHCAAKCGAERVYTFNLTDFRALAPAGLREKICAP